MSVCVYCSNPCFSDDICSECYRQLEEEQRRQEIENMIFKFFTAPDIDWRGLYDHHGRRLMQGDDAADEHAARELAKINGFDLAIYVVSEESYQEHFDGIGFPERVENIEPYATLINPL